MFLFILMYRFYDSNIIEVRVCFIISKNMNENLNKTLNENMNKNLNKNTSFYESLGY